MSGSKTPNLVNRGILEINAAPCGGEATLAVVGLTRSGTSLIASLLKALGVFMGKAVDGAVFEDVELAKLLDGEDFPALQQFIAGRDAEYALWGFKRPNAYKMLNRIEPLLRQPRVIVLFRDVLAIALRNHISMQMEVMPALPRLAAEYGHLVEAVSRLSCPCLLVSYEKFLQFPAESIDRVAAFAGMTPGDAKLAAALKVVENGSDKYLAASHLKYTGHVDRIVGGKLRGWAMVVGRPEVKAKVSLLVSGAAAGSTVARLPRKDLLDLGIGDGEHGFEIEIDPDTDAGGIVEVMAGNALDKLPNGGKPVSHYRSK